MPIWLTILLAIIQYAPEVIKIIINLFKKASPEVRKQLAPELKDACVALVKNKDKKPLEKLKEKLEELVHKN